jgi:hypothetical protein
VQVDALGGQVGVQVLPDAQGRVAEVVARIEPGERAHPPGQRRQLAQVHQPVVDAVGERALGRLPAHVPDRGFVQRGRRRP